MPRKPLFRKHRGTLSERAGPHRRTREAHLTETAEDYAELIDDLVRACGRARVADLAAALDVTHVTVVRTLARLKRDGIVAPAEALALTQAGRRIAARARRRHRIVLDFLMALGVGARAARQDAEGIEHHAGAATLRAFSRFLRSRKR